MNVTAREIEIMNDLDGVHYKGSVALGNLKRVITNDLRLPEYDLTEEPNFSLDSPGAKVRGWWMEFYDNYRFRNHNIGEMDRLKHEAEKRDRKVSFSVLTGRKPNEHPVTRHRMKRDGWWQHFDQHYLNPGFRSYQWKERPIGKSLESGKSVVVLDDDIMVGVAAERAYRRVLTEADPNEIGALATFIVCGSVLGLSLQRVAEIRGVTFPKTLEIVPTYSAFVDRLIEKMDNGEI